MSDDHAADIDKHVRTYLLVFAALLVLTVTTVAVTKLEVSVPLGIAIGLFIATIKGSLVACYFMHLITEKKFIIWIMAMTMFFFFVLMLLPVMTSMLDHPGV